MRLFIRGLAWDAGETGQSLVEVLASAAKCQLTTTAKGKVLSRSQSGGTMVEFILPPIGDMTPQDVAEVCSGLLDSAERITAATPSITDDALKVALLDEYPTPATNRSVRYFRPDFSFGLRR